MSGEEAKVKRGGRQACRYCGRDLLASDPQHKRFWPFCSERCKMAELGMWFEDRYVISRPLDEVTDDAGAKAPKPRNTGEKTDNS